MTRRFRRASAAGGAGAAAGLAVATIVLPQLTSIAGPTPLLTVLVTALLALIGAGVQRWIACGAKANDRADQRAAQLSALRVWPAALRDVALSDLGVFPARGAGPYRPGPEDGRIAELVEAGKSVLIIGHPRVGKSRTAAAVVAQAAGDRPAVVPADGAGLQWLIDNDPEVGVGVPKVLLWLDGLDRFLDVLSPSVLTSFPGATDPEIQILATMRSERWRELLHETGQSSETARACQEVCEVIELTEPRRSVLPTAAASAAQMAAEGPADGPAGGVPPPDVAAAAPWSDRGVRLLALLATAVLVGGIVIGVSSKGRSLVRPPPIADQITNTVHRLISGGRHVVLNERVQLHSTEDASWVVVTEDGLNGSDFYAGATGGPGNPRSDELRVYDVEGGWLRLKLDFRPQGRGKAARDWTVPAGAPPALDYNDDGTQEIIAGYEAPDAHEDLVPFVIDWQDSAYHLIPLLPDAPQLSSEHLSADAIRVRAALYLTPARLRNAVESSATKLLVGYQVQAFALSQTPAIRLLTGYYAQVPPQRSGDASVLEVRASQIGHSDLHARVCSPDTPFCPAPAHEQDAVIPPAKSLSNGLLQAWDERGRRWDTPVKLRPAARLECPHSPAPTSPCSSAQP